MPTDGPLIEKKQARRRKPIIIKNLEENKKLKLRKEAPEISGEEISKKDEVKEDTPKSLPSKPEKPKQRDDLELEFNM